MYRIVCFVAAAILQVSCGGGGGSTGTPPGNNPVPAAIYEVQGNGATSPLEGQLVSVAGVVTGDFQDGDADTRRNLGGFFIQGAPDGDFATSDGVFVFDGNNPATDVNPGDSVDVVGTVTERFGETQVVANSVTLRGAGAILPAPINLPAASTVTNSDGEPIADLERFEGMIVRLPQSLTVADLFNLERYGEISLVQGGRPFQFTNLNFPDVLGYDSHRESLAARTIMLDDGRDDTNPNPITYLTAGAGPGYSIRSGDEIANVTGNLRFSRGSGSAGKEAYRLEPTIDPVFASTNPRSVAPDVDGALRVVGFNVLNFFSTIDPGQNDCGPNGTSSCHGADSQAEFDRQLAKLVTALDMIDADICGLVEIENNSGVALQVLVDALNAVSTRSYDLIDTGPVGGSAVTTAFIYDTLTVGVSGPAVILDAGVDPRFNDSLNRPAVAQAFTQLSNNAGLSIVVTHLKSKAASCSGNSDPDIGDGQANCNISRTEAAAAMADWIATDPTNSGDTDYLIVGDLNAHVFEDPLTALKNAGFNNLIETRVGANAYSFVFQGESGSLDHALASSSLAPQVADVVEWHINADEPPARDYNLESARDPSLFDPTTPYRSSDHDPIIVGLNLTN